jgi:heme exporter protein C
MHRYANPTRFLRLAGYVLPWTATLTVVLLLAGLYLGLVASPADYQQSESVRIMYVHVPSAWMALFVYMVVAGASLVSLVWKHPLADLIAKAASPVGASSCISATSR